MIFDLKPYPAMEPSDVEWLGDVPEHWEVRRLKTILADRVTDGPHLTPTFVANGIPFLSVDGIQSGELVFEDCRYVSLEDHVEFSKKAAPRRGDLLLGKAASTGKLARVKVDFEFSIWSPLALIRSDQSQVLSEFLEYALKDVSAQVQIEMLCTLNTQKNIGMADIPRLIVGLPPRPEQVAIVRYLNHADREITRYIQTKQRLIELLEEEKQVIIHRAVTRGLDPNVPLKPSGVEWLGDVPEHWQVRKLRVLFNRHGSGTTPPGDEHYGGGVPWVMTGDLTDGNVDTTRRTVNSAAVESVSALRMYPARSLVVAMYGATIGRTGILSMDACTNQACCVLADPVNGTDVYFLQAVVTLARPHLIEQSYGGGQPNINSEIVKNLRVPVPPPNEQKAISTQIARTAEKQVIDRARREIELLGEYRTRLIADVVTGKLDVRKTAATLPEVDPLDLEDIIEIDELTADELAPEVEEVAP